jgi:hypothetical protein
MGMAAEAAREVIGRPPSQAALHGWESKALLLLVALYIFVLQPSGHPCTSRAVVKGRPGGASHWPSLRLGRLKESLCYTSTAAGLP